VVVVVGSGQKGSAGGPGSPSRAAAPAQCHGLSIDRDYTQCRSGGCAGRSVWVQVLGGERGGQVHLYHPVDQFFNEEYMVILFIIPPQGAQGMLWQ
jgi:hypothetical protein